MCVVGLLDFLMFPGYSRTAEALRPEGVTGLPWQGPQNPLSQIVVDDVFGDAWADLVDRAAAMKVPPVIRGRALIVGAIADLPMYAWQGDTKVQAQPTWLYRTNGISLWHRMAWTIDDLIFHDASLWWRENGEDGFPLWAQRIDFDNWRTNTFGQIEYKGADQNWHPAPSKNVIYIPGPGTPLLGADDTIRGARRITRAWVARVRSPIPPTLFTQTEPDTASEADVKNLTSSWGNARTNPETAGVGFVPYGLGVQFATPNDDAQLFVEGRNAVRLDVANALNIPASLLDGSTATASLTYTTAEGQKSSFHEQTLRYWTAPIEHRLSMDDVVPRGQRVRFDITYTTQVPPTGEPGED